jgi:NitT/TauT family transport system substrate-binding protein
MGAPSKPSNTLPTALSHAPDRRDWLRGLGRVGAGLLMTGGAASGLVGCVETAVEPESEPAPLRLGMDLWAGYYPALLAEELGYFAEAQVKVQISFPANTDRMMADFAAGRYDVIGVALGDLISATQGRAPVQVFLVTDESAGGDAVLARRGLVLENASRLRLATNLGGFGELFSREFLRRQGIAADRVAWLNADAADVPRLLATGQVDLAHTWEPYVSESLASGALKLFSSAETPGLILDVLAAPRAVAERRRDELRRFTTAWLQAVDWWLQAPREGVRRIARRLQRDAAQVSLDGVKLIRRAENRRLLGADGQAAMAAAVGRYSAFFLDKGSLARPVDPADLLRADLLP